MGEPIDSDDDDTAFAGAIRQRASNRPMTNQQMHANMILSTNPSAQFDNDDFIGRVVYVVEQTLKHRIANYHKQSIRNLIRSLPHNNLVNVDKAKLVPSIAKKWLNDVYDTAVGDAPFDVQSYLVRNMDNNTDNDISTGVASGQINFTPGTPVQISQILNAADPYDILRLLNPVALHTHATLSFDTRYRSLDTNGINTFKFNLANNASLQTGAINILPKVRDIVSMKIMPLRLPATSAVRNDLRLVTMYIQELSGQSIVSAEGRRYQFAFNALYDDESALLTPLNDGIYRFDKPLTSLDSLSISFGNPFQVINFDTDRLNATISNYGTETEFTTSTSHSLGNLELVYISRFTTSDTASDAAAIANVNAATGWKANLVDGSTTKFTIPVDTSSVNQLGGLNVTVYFQSRRIIGHIELTYIRPKDG